jgi:uncharacterized oligopeptide transporter (OPT) family protein
MLLGGGLALGAEALRIPSLAFAIGLYLPVTTSASLILGGLVSWWVQRQASVEVYAQQHERATLFASGLIAGDALMGIGIAVLVVSGLDQSLAVRTAGSGLFEHVLTLIPFAVLAWWLVRMARGRT